MLTILSNLSIDQRYQFLLFRSCDGLMIHCWSNSLVYGSVMTTIFAPVLLSEGFKRINPDENVT